jgi:hypothetical protein
MFYRNIENNSNAVCCDENSLNTSNYEEYKEGIRMKLMQIIGARDFKDFIRDAVKELMSEL